MYVDPADVTSPKDRVREVKVLYDGGEESVSVVSLRWGDEESIGMRWNVANREWDDEKLKEEKTCVGMPSSRGYPVWFILPKDLFDSQSDLNKAIKYKV